MIVSIIIDAAYDMAANEWTNSDVPQTATSAVETQIDNICNNLASRCRSFDGSSGVSNGDAFFAEIAREAKEVFREHG